MANHDHEQQEHVLLMQINDRIKTMAAKMEAEQIVEYVQLLNRPRKLIVMNLVSGIFRGIGVVIGLTVFTAVILYMLRALGALNLPIIGDFIADIIKIVEQELRTRPF